MTVPHNYGTEYSIVGRFPDKIAQGQNRPDIIAKNKVGDYVRFLHQ